MKKSQLKEMIREIIREEFKHESQASDDAKRQGLEYKGFGRWGKDGKITHTTQSGKLVPVRDPNTGQADRKLLSPPRVHKSPEAQRQKNQPKDSLGQQPYVSLDNKTLPPAGQKIIDKVEDKFTVDAGDKLATKYGYYEDFPFEEFEKETGINARAAKYYSDNNNSYDKGFEYDAERNTVQIYDPMDL